MEPVIFGGMGAGTGALRPSPCPAGMPAAQHLRRRKSRACSVTLGTFCRMNGCATLGGFIPSLCKIPMRRRKCPARRRELFSLRKKRSAGIRLSAWQRGASLYRPAPLFSALKNNGNPMGISSRCVVKRRTAETRDSVSRPSLPAVITYSPGSSSGSEGSGASWGEGSSALGVKASSPVMSLRKVSPLIFSYSIR